MKGREGKRWFGGRGFGRSGLVLIAVGHNNSADMVFLLQGRHVEPYSWRDKSKKETLE